MSGDISDRQDFGSAPGISQVEAKDAAKDPMMFRTGHHPNHKELFGPNVNSAKVEKPCL